MIEHLRTPEMPTSTLPFSPATAFGNLLFISGQASVDLEGKLVPDTFEGEMRRSMENLRRILEAAGSGLDKVLQVRAFVDDIEDLAEFNRLYREYFHEPYPARTTILNCFKGALKFEIDCIAVRENS